MILNAIILLIFAFIRRTSPDPTLKGDFMTLTSALQDALDAEQAYWYQCFKAQNGYPFLDETLLRLQAEMLAAAHEGWGGVWIGFMLQPADMDTQAVLIEYTPGLSEAWIPHASFMVPRHSQSLCTAILAYRAALVTRPYREEIIIAARTAIFKQVAEEGGRLF